MGDRPYRRRCCLTVSALADGLFQLAGSRESIPRPRACFALKLNPVIDQVEPAEDCGKKRPADGVPHRPRNQRRENHPANAKCTCT